MKNFISAIIAVSLCLPVLAQKAPPSKSKIPGKTEIDKKPSKEAGKKEVKIKGDSSKDEIKMDKPLDQYFDSLNLTKRQVEQIGEIEEFMNQRQGMSRAQIKMTNEQILSEEKENMRIRNNKIHDILTPEQIKEIYLLQNGKLKVNLSADEVIGKMELKPSQQEEINKINSQFKNQFDEANKIEDEADRLATTQRLENEKEKNYKEILNDREKELFDAIKIGKEKIVTDKEKKEMDMKAKEASKKG